MLLESPLNHTSWLHPVLERNVVVELVLVLYYSITNTTYYQARTVICKFHSFSYVLVLGVLDWEHPTHPRNVTGTSTGSRFTEYPDFFLQVCGVRLASTTVGWNLVLRTYTMAVRRGKRIDSLELGIHVMITIERKRTS